MANQSIYRRFIEAHPDSPFYHQPWWLDTTCGSEGWSVALISDQDDITGALPFQIRRKLGWVKLKTPDFTPHSGPWFKPSQREKPHGVMAEFEGRLGALIQALPRHQSLDIKFNPELPYALPMHWMGKTELTMYTYQLKVDKADNQFEAFNRTVRKSLQNSTYDIKEIDTKLFIEFLKKNNAHYSTQQRETLAKIMFESNKRGMGFILGAFDGAALSGVLTGIIDQNKVYFLASAVQSAVPTNMSFYALVWHVVQKFENEIDLIDFMGSQDPAVARSFRALSASPVRLSRMVNSNLLKRLI